MLEDVTHGVRQRLREWTALLLGNFASFRLEEDDEKFVLYQDPCGSCGRRSRSSRIGLRLFG